MQSVLEILKSRGLVSTSEPMDAEAWEQIRVESANNVPGNLDKEDGCNCPKCKNRGYIMVPKQYNGTWTSVARECECMVRRRSVRLMKASGLEKSIREYTFERFRAEEEWQRQIKDAAMEYAKAPEGWFCLLGQTGCGKTHLCTAICRELLLQNRQVVYVLWRDVIVKLKATVTDVDRYAEMMDRYKSAEILYVDDLFKIGRGWDGDTMKPSAADVNIAFELLNYRYINHKSTIISSECSIEALADIDEALAGRIYQRAKTYSIDPDKAKNYRFRNRRDA